MLELEKSFDLLIPGLTIENIDSNKINTCFDVCYKDMVERVILSTPPYRKSCQVAFHPICIDRVTDAGMVLSVGNPIKRSKLFVNNYMEADIDAIPMHVSSLIQEELNKYFTYQMTNNFLSYEILLRNSQTLISSSEAIPFILNIAEMKIYDINDFIAEALNSCIEEIYNKSKKNPNGYNSTSISSFLREITTSQLTQYIEKCPSNIQRKILEVDNEDKIILPQACAGEILSDNIFVAQNDGPQSEDSGRVVHKYISTQIINRTFATTDPFIPFSRLQATSPYCRHIFQNRMQVRRACVTQNLDLLNNEPLVISEITKDIPVPGMTLHVAFFQWGFTLEDGIIISRSAADKMTGFKLHEDSFEVDTTNDNTSLEFKVSVLENVDIDKIIKNYREYFNLNPNCRFRRKGLLISLPTGNVRTTAKIPGIVIGIEAEDTHQQTNTGNGAIITKKTKFTVRSILRYKLDVGDKMAGYYHGNKGTISRIIEDDNMPLIDGERVDVVMDPSICKRGIPSVVFECSDSIEAKQTGKPKYINILNEHKHNVDNCYGRLTFENDEFGNTVNTIMETFTDKDKVLHGYIRMARLDHNSVEKLTYTNRAEVNSKGIHNPGAITMPGIQYVLYAKGCHHAMDEVMSDNGILDSIENYMHIFGRSINNLIEVKGDNNVP